MEIVGPTSMQASLYLSFMFASIMLKCLMHPPSGWPGVPMRKKKNSQQPPKNNKHALYIVITTTTIMTIMIFLMIFMVMTMMMTMPGTHGDDQVAITREW